MTLAPPLLKNPGSQDFADWLPPILVKELRQGLRGHVFVGVFVIVQAAMVILVGLRLGDEQNALDLDSYQWVSIGVALMVLLPLRALPAISDETRQQTIDLVRLTHLSSIRMVWGKWLALVSQTALLVVSLLPYQVLYYFFGGVDVVENLQILAWTLALSLMLTALCLAVSPTGALVRLVILGPVGMFLYAMWRNEGPPIIERTDPEFWPAIIGGVMGTVFVLAVAALRISHPAENASARVRGVALLVVLSSTIGFALACSHDGGTWLLPGILALYWTGFESMTEQASALPSIYTPWVKRGLVGRIVGRLFYPGFGTGILFTLLGLTIQLAAFFSVAGKEVPGRWIYWSAPMNFFHMGMAVLFPGVLMGLFSTMRQRHWLYVILQLTCAGWYVCVHLSSFGSERTGALIAAGNPLSAFLWTRSMTDGWFTSVIWGPTAKRLHDWLACQYVAVSVEAVMLAILLIRSRTEFRTIRDGEARARLMLQSSSAAS